MEMNETYKAQEINKTHMVQEAPETYMIHKAPLQGYVSNNNSGKKKYYPTYY